MPETPPPPLPYAAFIIAKLITVIAANSRDLENINLLIVKSFPLSAIVLSPFSIKKSRSNFSLTHRPTLPKPFSVLRVSTFSIANFRKSNCNIFFLLYLLITFSVTLLTIVTMLPIFYFDYCWLKIVLYHCDILPFMQ